MLHYIEREDYSTLLSSYEGLEGETKELIWSDMVRSLSAAFTNEKCLELERTLEVCLRNVVGRDGRMCCRVLV